MSERARACLALFLCCSGAHASLAAQDSRAAAPAMTRLEQLGREALAIAVVKLEQPFEPTRQSPSRARRDKHAAPEFAAARCEVERVLYGHTELAGATLRATARGTQVPELLRLDKGAALLLFLPMDPIDGLPESMRRDLRELPASALAEGAWPIERVDGVERFSAPPAALPLPAQLAKPADAPLLVSELSAWLDALIARTTPSVRMNVASTGLPDHRRLDRDGYFESWVAPKEGWLDEPKCEAFFARWSELRVDELPSSFGTSQRPGDPAYAITIKGRTSARTIRFQQTEAPNVPVGPERARIARGLAALELLRTL